MTDPRVAALAEALLHIAYPWHDPKVDDPPVMEVGDLSNSGTATPWGLAAAILAALPPDWCGHDADMVARLIAFAERVAASGNDTPGTRAAARYALTGSLESVVDEMRAALEEKV